MTKIIILLIFLKVFLFSGINLWALALPGMQVNSYEKLMSNWLNDDVTKSAKEKSSEILKEIENNKPEQVLILLYQLEKINPRQVKQPYFIGSNLLKTLEVMNNDKYTLENSQELVLKQKIIEFARIYLFMTFLCKKDSQKGKTDELKKIVKDLKKKYKVTRHNGIYYQLGLIEIDISLLDTLKEKQSELGKYLSEIFELVFTGAGKSLAGTINAKGLSADTFPIKIIYNVLEKSIESIKKHIKEKELYKRFEKMLTLSSQAKKAVNNEKELNIFFKLVEEYSKQSIHWRVNCKVLDLLYYIIKNSSDKISKKAFKKLEKFIGFKKYIKWMHNNNWRIRQKTIEILILLANSKPEKVSKNIVSKSIDYLDQLKNTKKSNKKRETDSRILYFLYHPEQILASKLPLSEIKEIQKIIEKQEKDKFENKLKEMWIEQRKGHIDIITKLDELDENSKDKKQEELYGGLKKIESIVGKLKVFKDAVTINNKKEYKEIQKFFNNAQIIYRNLTKEVGNIDEKLKKIIKNTDRVMIKIDESEKEIKNYIDKVLYEKNKKEQEIKRKEAEEKERQKEKIKKNLKIKLQTRYTDDNYTKLELILGQNKLDISKSYVNLAIVKEKEQNKKEKNIVNGSEQKLAKKEGKIIDENEKEQLGIRNNWEDIYQPKEKIKLDDIFKINKKQQNVKAQRLAILGRAGIGKSTLCKRIAYDWASGKEYLKKFKYVFEIKLRNLNKETYPTEKNITDIVARECYGIISTEEKHALKEIIKNESDKILYVLDGYDELNIPQYLKLQLEELKKQKNVIMTSRPISNIPGMDIRLENIGFVDLDIDKYVRMYFGTEKQKKAEKLIKFLENNSQIRDITHIPINLEIICSLWDVNSEKLGKIGKISVLDLYEQINLLFYRRCLEKQGDKQIADKLDEQVLEDCVQEIKILSKMAYLGMKEQKIILGKEIIKNAIDRTYKKTMRYILKLGFMKPFKKTRKIIENEYYFLHLTFQEYYSAKWIVDYAEKEERENFIKENKYKPIYRVMFGFITGLLSKKKDKTELKQFFELLNEEPIDGHNLMLINCLNNIEYENYEYVLGKERLDELIKWVEDGIRKVKVQKKLALRLDDIILFLSKIIIEDDKTMINVLVKFVKDKEVYEKYRTKALKILGEIAQNDSRMKSILVDFIHDKTIDGEYRSIAVEILWEMGFEEDDEVISALVKFIKDRNVDREYRTRALKILGEIAQNDSRMKSILVDFICDKTIYGEYRIITIDILNEMGFFEEDDSVINVLVEFIKDRDVYGKYRTRALKILGEIFQNDSRMKSILVDFIKDKTIYGEYRIIAIDILNKMGFFEEDDNGINILVKFIKDRDVYGEYRTRALKILVKIVHSKQSILVDFIRDKTIDGKYRIIAIDILSVDFMKNKTIGGRYRNISIDILNRMGFFEEDDIVINVLIEFVKDKSIYGNYRIQVLRILAKTVPNDSRMKSILVDFMKDKTIDGEYRIIAIDILYEIGLFEVDNSVINVLVEFFKDKNLSEVYKRRVLRILGEIVQNDSSKKSILVDFIKDKTRIDSKYCNIVIEILSKMKFDDDEVVSALVEFIKNKRAFVREQKEFIRARKQAKRRRRTDISHPSKRRYRRSKFFSNSNSNSDSNSDFDSDSDSDSEILHSAVSYRLKAVEALGKIGKADDEVIETLADFIDNEELNEDELMTALSALSKLGRANNKDLNRKLKKITGEYINDIKNMDYMVKLKYDKKKFFYDCNLQERLNLPIKNIKFKELLDILNQTKPSNNFLISKLAEQKNFKIEIRVLKKGVNLKRFSLLSSFEGNKLVIYLNHYCLKYPEAGALAVWVQIYKALKNEHKDNVFVNEKYDVDFEALNNVYSCYANVLQIVDKERLMQDLIEMEKKGILNTNYFGYQKIFGKNFNKNIKVSDIFKDLPTNDIDSGVDYLEKHKESMVLLYLA